MKPPTAPTCPAPDRGAGAPSSGPARADEAAWLLSVQEALDRVAVRAQDEGARAAPARPGAQRALAAWALALVAAALLAGLGWKAFSGAPRGAVPALSATPVGALTLPAAPDVVAAQQRPAAGGDASASSLPPPAPDVAAPAPSSRVALVADSTDAAGVDLARALAGALGAGGGALPPVLQARGWSDALDRLAVDQPRLAIARYDALRVAQHGAAVPLAVVAPLPTQEIQVAVRADAPLRHLHELRGLRINAGPGAGARRLSARTLYESLFDQPLPATPAGELDEAPALDALLRGELDAVVLVAPQPALALALLPAQRLQALRLLALEPAHPASRRALDVFLPARLRAQRFPPGLVADGMPTLALMSFLVASGRRTPQADAALEHVAAALCRALPALGRADAAWAAVDLRLRVPTGWPLAAPAEAALRDCVSLPTAAAPVPPPR